MHRLTIASLNTRGTPLLGLRSRYRAIGAAFEASDADIVNLQEVHTYYHLRLLSRSMPSYFSNFRPSAAGPTGGLVTYSRRVAGRSSYRRYPLLVAAHKGVLCTRLADLTVLNTHLLANRDGDWRPDNRYYPAHQAQLATLAQYVVAVDGPVVLTGDFNIPRTSTLYRDFVRSTDLTDAFGESCPPTFHQAYLPPGRSPHCIDFVLTSGAVDSARLDDSFPSDHLALEVRLRL